MEHGFKVTKEGMSKMEKRMQPTPVFTIRIEWLSSNHPYAYLKSKEILLKHKLLMKRSGLSKNLCLNGTR